MLAIGKAAQYLGFSIDTLRRWSDKGDLKPTFITPGGHRYYSLDDLDRFNQDIFVLAKDWVYAQDPFEPKNDYYCPDQQTFQSRLGKLEIILRDTQKVGDEYSLISLIVGEIGNNSFDHNLGTWPDIRGIFFAHDPQRRKIVLADRGRGVQETLKQVKPEIKNDQEALTIAFTEIISGRAPENRGNGLKSVREVIKNIMKDILINLYFQSGSAALVLEQGNDYKMIAPERAIRGCLAMITY